MKNTEPKTIDEMAAELAAHEKAAAEKRAALQAALEAENLRRSPLRLLIEKRKTLIATITRNKSSIAAHASDAAEFEKLCDAFFNTTTGSQSRMYNFLVPTLNYPHAMGERAVELLTRRLTKAEKDLSDQWK